MFQAGGSQFMVPQGKLDKINDKKMPSTGAQNLLESIHISENRHETVIVTKHIAKSNCIEKTL